eukprot:TRINITY_DN460_c0_g1_i2.p2 TRINITY_DN460_c0_g1~~TRINITY_DN460_c0_g1_i2.p2  ORF type:complete len:102 (+),score=6.68 TRINITY_DN460_c0_g1_i2:157-462(+)
MDEFDGSSSVVVADVDCTSDDHDLQRVYCVSVCVRAPGAGEGDPNCYRLGVPSRKRQTCALAENVCQTRARPPASIGGEVLLLGKAEEHPEAARRRVLRRS